MTLPGIRPTFVLIVLSVIGLMGYGLYTQYYGGLEPCPLCMTQRFFYVLVGVFALIGSIHLSGRRVYGGLVALAALGGVITAGRQTWLQHLPEGKAPACGPSLEYMLETFPFSEALKMLFLGDGNCAKIDWTFLGLSMAEWSLLCFIILLCAGLWQMRRR